jgi:hypothetical protein
VIELVTSGTITPIVDRTYPLAEVEGGVERLTHCISTSPLSRSV